MISFLRSRAHGCVLLLALVLVTSLLPGALAQGTKKKSAAAIDAEDAKAIAKIKPVGAPQVYKSVDGRSLRVFILNPPDWKATDRRPAILFFHGGGWETGKGAPQAFNAQAQYFVTRGVVCLLVEYRLITNNRKEAPIGACQDAKSAMRWARSHAAELGVDPNRIASAGGSAGGHLAAFVGMVEGTDDPRDDLRISCRPNAMLLYNPALLQGQLRPDDPKPAVSSELAKTYATISPFASVTPNDPPGIILVGTEDNILPQSVLKAFQEKCRAAGVRMDAVVYPGEGHSFFGIARSHDRFFDTTIEVDKFLGSLGWVEGPPTLTRAMVEKLGESVPHQPNKLERERAKMAPKN
jgi:acetyl esterase/lipase